MDGDLISRKAILEAIDKREEIVQKLTANVDDEAEMTATLSAVREFVRNRPAVNAEPVRHGRWRHLGGDEWRCTMCGDVIHTEGSEKPEDKYCRECGARMDGEARKQWKLNGSYSRTDCRKSGKR